MFIKNVTKLIFTPGVVEHSIVVIEKGDDGKEQEYSRSITTNTARWIAGQVHIAVQRGYGIIWPTSEGWVYVTHPGRGDERRRARERGPWALRPPRRVTQGV